MGFFDRISSGLHRSRDKFKEQMNILLDRGPDVDEEFWETLEEALILSDFGAAAADAIVEELRDEATRKALPDAYAVLDLLAEKIADQFIETDGSIFDDEAVVLFVGVNGSGKTTTVGKIAAEAHGNDRKVPPIRSGRQPSNSSKNGRAEPMSRSFHASAGAIQQACATKRSSALSKRVRIWCSSIQQGDCIPQTI